MPNNCLVTIVHFNATRQPDPPSHRYRTRSTTTRPSLRLFLDHEASANHQGGSDQLFLLHNRTRSARASRRIVTDVTLDDDGMWRWWVWQLKRAAGFSAQIFSSRECFLVDGLDCSCMFNIIPTVQRPTARNLFVLWL